jgi:hypothetical protein
MAANDPSLQSPQQTTPPATAVQQVPPQSTVSPHSEPNKATSAPTPAGAGAPAVAAPTREQRIAAACKSMFLHVKELVGHHFSHEAACKKCGWHSMQHSEGAATEMGDRHVIQHWRDVTAFVDEQSKKA